MIPRTLLAALCAETIGVPGVNAQDTTTLVAEEPEPARVEVRGELLDAYQGEYELEGVDLRVTFTRDGDDLVARPAGQEQVTLTAESDSVFTVPQISARIVFLPEAGPEP